MSAHPEIEAQLSAANLSDDDHEALSALLWNYPRSCWDSMIAAYFAGQGPTPNSAARTLDKSVDDATEAVGVLLSTASPEALWQAYLQVRAAVLETPFEPVVGGVRCPHCGSQVVTLDCVDDDLRETCGDVDTVSRTVTFDTTTIESDEHQMLIYRCTTCSLPVGLPSGWSEA